MLTNDVTRLNITNGHAAKWWMRNLQVSPQFDVIFEDSSATQNLYDGENGWQYFPYECVFAVGRN